ncbi:MAG: dihydrolipoyl dehydrogenase family protein, partial [Planctomycetota bacterium]
RRDRVVDETRRDISELLASHGVTVLGGEGRLSAPGVVDFAPNPDSDHPAGALRCDHVVIDTGSQPIAPPGFATDHPAVIYSNRLVSITEQPRRLVIVGGGVIGLEFATTFAALGTEVTIVEMMDRLVPFLDEEITATISTTLEQRGVRIMTGHAAAGMDADELVVRPVEDGNETRIPADTVLLAIGRRPVLDTERLERCGIDHDPKTGIATDAYLRSSVPGVWAIGDATGESILAHVGMQQGIICAENITASSPVRYRAMDYRVVPTVVYTLPEIVALGDPGDEPGLRCVRLPFTNDMRAQIEDRTAGVLKLWLRADRLVAAQAIGHNVSEFAQELALMIAHRLPIADVAEIIHPHPSYCESIRVALRMDLGTRISPLREA